MMLLLLVGCESPPPKKMVVTRLEYARITAGDKLNCNQMDHYVRPVYPKEAKRKDTQGTVKLRGVITKTGEVREIEVLQGDSLLVPAAVDAVKKWHYTPCTINSDPVELLVGFDIAFPPNR
jgi:TonB family protein